MLAIPGEKIAILIVGSAIKVVAIGIQTPAVTKSTSMQLCDVTVPAVITAADRPKMLSDKRSTVPKDDVMVCVISSRTKNKLAHSPRDPPSSRRPIDIF